MRFITQNQFINIFSSPKDPLSSFIRRAKVRTNNTITPLLKYIENKSVTLDDLRLLYEHIIHRDEYLARFYKTSLNVLNEDGKIDLTMNVPAMKMKEMNNDQLVHYKNVIRNMHYLDILKNTKSGIANVPTYMEVLEDMYLHWIIDYKILTPSSLHYLREGRIGSVFSSLFFRASIMSPVIPYSLAHNILRGKSNCSIFTPTLGWSSYSYGFLESPLVQEYVGTDVIQGVCKKTKEFAERFYPDKTATIFCSPSEDLMGIKGFSKKYSNYFDLVFFSPPYYRLEMYSGKNQSTSKYKNYEEWLEKYWRNTMLLCYHVLKPGGKMCYILSGYGSENTNGGRYDLLKDMNGIARVVFKNTSPQILNMYNKNVHVTTHRDTAEKIVIFPK
jgi:hypothetical protein